jgi:hypothetical protein
MDIKREDDETATIEARRRRNKRSKMFLKDGGEDVPLGMGILVVAMLRLLCTVLCGCVCTPTTARMEWKVRLAA